MFILLIFIIIYFIMGFLTMSIFYRYEDFVEIESNVGIEDMAGLILWPFVLIFLLFASTYPKIVNYFLKLLWKKEENKNDERNNN